MGKQLKIKVKRPWIAYSGSTVQQNYGEDIDHGYLLWDIKSCNEFDVEFKCLPNPHPYVTIDWCGDLKKTLKKAKTYPQGSRFRIRSNTHISQKDVSELSAKLKSQMLASEVTFKLEQQVSSNVLTTPTITLLKEDLRKPNVILRLLREYYSDSDVTEDEWLQIDDLITSYLTTVEGDGTTRNTKWSLRHLTFDNMFCYGPSNVVNFSNLSGIVGIFGSNRSGKSSIVGTIMYALFNATDRGAIKNIHVCNARRPYCLSKAIVNINGSDHVIERQTTKSENKKGIVSASTSLNFFKIDENGEAIDKSGIQRNDTEKDIRRLLGTSEDFLMTSLSAQNDTNQFIDQGSTKRRKLLSRFLDLDVFFNMFELANFDLNQIKTILKKHPAKDWELLERENRMLLNGCSENITNFNIQLSEFRDALSLAKTNLLNHDTIVPVTEIQVIDQKSRVNSLSTMTDTLKNNLESKKSDLKSREQKIEQIDLIRSQNDIKQLKHQLESYRKLESVVVTLQHDYEKEKAKLDHQSRSLNILDDVPCGDLFPTCKFIKDAYKNKDLISEQRLLVSSSKITLDDAQSSLHISDGNELNEKIKKLEKLGERRSELRDEFSSIELDIVKLEGTLEDKIENLEIAKCRLDELKEAYKNEENAEVVQSRNEIMLLEEKITKLDSEKMNSASESGKLLSEIEVLKKEQSEHNDIVQKMKIYDLVARAFSKKGIPNHIIVSQLPLINAEIAQILNGIVEFTVELEKEDDGGDNMDVYINYGDSKRIIELGSGMEKIIASIAIRVALINVSSLPKTDMLIIDEGFGVLDDSGVEACNRLLASLKRFFRIVLVITHVDGIKDSADHVIEITKNEKDANVVYN